MAMPPPLLARDRLSPRLFQTVLVTLLILIFIAIATPRIWELRVAAEQTHVMHTVGALHSAIGIQVMERVLRGGLTAVADMERANPMDYLDPPPPNYQRLAGPVPPERLAPRRWYYEPQQGILIYRVAYGEYLDTALPGPPRIRFQLQLRYADRNGNGRYDAGSEDLDGVGLVALEPYAWRKP